MESIISKAQSYVAPVFESGVKWAKNNPKAATVAAVALSVQFRNVIYSGNLEMSPPVILL